MVHGSKKAIKKSESNHSKKMKARKVRQDRKAGSRSSVDRATAS